MKTLNILAPVVVAASLLAGANAAYALAGNPQNWYATTVQIEQAVAAAKARANAVATKDAGTATKTQ
ncbi:MAG: hypothetical protein QF926_07380 [Alphaproteobacteria bacterium]|jgi:precorrin-2 methylase|nr:hypothetical protein [Alphaproteobacteria bacterium]MDP6516428.1 hypothetical protein [Alphaproteobacteria bacterium]|tara:strand:+ start:115 stop:315 length:201 start_codon:yes stop_codon:yes gene_type:complete